MPAPADPEAPAQPPVGGVPREEIPWHDDRAVEALNRYGAAHAGTFGGLWLDQQARAITLAFTDAPENHIAALKELAPGSAIQVVQVGHSEAELNRLQERIAGDHEALRDLGFEMYSISTDIMANTVAVEGAALDPEAAEAAILEHYGVDFLRVTVHPAPGPEPLQPDRGEGWRLLRELPETGGAYTVDFAADQPKYEQLWQEVGQAGSPPPVDFASEVVLRFGGVVGSSCPQIHFAGVLVDPVQRLVYGDISHPVPAGAICTADAIGHNFIVAVERSMLPESPFTLRLTKEDPCPACEDDDVLVDLGD